LPPGLGRPRLRADSGFFDQHLATAALAGGCDFAICARRNPALWRAVRAVPADAWRAAVGTAGAEVACCTYRPEGWPQQTRAVVRRVALDASRVSADPRSRRWRTIDPQQLRLARAGKLDQVYGYTVILTSLRDDPVAVEAWFRHRADIEDRIRDAKLGYALRHLPSGHLAVNRVWLWATLLALNLAAWTQALGLGASSRAHAKRLRRELICVPGRLVRHARHLVLRLPPHARHLVAAYARLRALPTPTG
jgi:Transposase DDE domain group 1